MKSLFLLLLFVSLSFGETFWVSQNATGIGDTKANATNYTFFNTAGNWGSGAGKISAGDTVWFTGQITNALTIQGSGDIGSKIYIQWDTNAYFEKGIWGASGAITASGKSNIVLDGFYNGVIESTNNGSVSLGFGNATYNNGVYFTGCQDFEIKNLTIRNMYQREQSDDSTTCCGSSFNAVNGIEIWGQSSGLSVHNNTIHDGGAGVNIIYPASTVINTLNVFSNTIYHCIAGVQIGSASNGGTVNDLSIYANTIYDGEKWLDPSDDFHAHLIMVWKEGTGNNINRLKIYGNHTYGDWDPGSHMTGHIFLSTANNEGFNDTEIYNNLMVVGAGSTPGNGVIEAQGRLNGLLIANNTIIGDTGAGLAIRLGNAYGGNTNLVIKNNVIENLEYYINTATFQGTTDIDYNFYDNPLVPSGRKFRIGGVDYSSLAAWQALGHDAHSQEATLNLTVTYGLNANSPAKGNGVDLSAEFTTDRLNYTRTLPWDGGSDIYRALSPEVSGRFNNGFNINQSRGRR